MVSGQSFVSEIDQMCSSGLIEKKENDLYSLKSSNLIFLVLFVSNDFFFTAFSNSLKRGLYDDVEEMGPLIAEVWSVKSAEDSKKRWESTLQFIGDVSAKYGERTYNPDELLLKIITFTGLLKCSKKKFDVSFFFLFVVEFKEKKLGKKCRIDKGRL